MARQPVQGNRPAVSFFSAITYPLHTLGVTSKRPRKAQALLSGGPLFLTGADLCGSRSAAKDSQLQRRPSVRTPAVPASLFQALRSCPAMLQDLQIDRVDDTSLADKVILGVHFMWCFELHVES